MSCSCTRAASVLPELTAKQGLRLLAALISVLTEPSLLPSLQLSPVPCTRIVPCCANPAPLLPAPSSMPCFCAAIR